MTKCPHDPYAFYDDWGNRHLVFSHREYEVLARVIELTYLLDTRW